ncbi:uncharacterized protein LOC118429668 [Branchiostoma floridae]|uniref:Uncharacterized protein LOC118429668 n=1 Tax=Branchiostoma floridae TaxID=7739 RepID=A0A9J7M7B0_BRAFL|nr:uncharacterized protein LOC118429668 [Branchiostoma floridae]
MVSSSSKTAGFVLYNNERPLLRYLVYRGTGQVSVSDTGHEMVTVVEADNTLTGIEKIGDNLYMVGTAKTKGKEQAPKLRFLERGETVLLTASPANRVSAAVIGGELAPMAESDSSDIAQYAKVVSVVEDDTTEADRPEESESSRYLHTTTDLQGTEDKLDDTYPSVRDAVSS